MTSSSSSSSSSSTTAISSVIIASASSVLKTFLIGATGFFAVKYPRNNPLLPMESVSMLSRMSFALLSVPLIYTGIAANLSPISNRQNLMNLGFMIVAAWSVLFISYGVATGMKWLVMLLMKQQNSHPTQKNPNHNNPNTMNHNENSIHHNNSSSSSSSIINNNNNNNFERDFDALRISATFPNTLAIPILVFPTLCEYEIVYQSFADSISIYNPNNETLSVSELSDLSVNVSPEELIQQCNENANGMVFSYFFAWSLLFWSIGNQILVTAGKKRQCIKEEEEEVEEEAQSFSSSSSSPPSSSPSSPSSYWTHIKAFLLPILQSSGFIAMMIGFATSCIPPLQKALFIPGGVLRFLGSALESLATAATSITCILVAASLAAVHTTNHPKNHRSTTDTFTPINTDSTHDLIHSPQEPQEPPQEQQDLQQPQEQHYEEEEDYPERITEMTISTMTTHATPTATTHATTLANDRTCPTRLNASRKRRKWSLFWMDHDLQLPMTSSTTHDSHDTNLNSNANANSKNHNLMDRDYNTTSQQKKNPLFMTFLHQFSTSVRTRSHILLTSIQHHPTIQIHLWYNLSRLIISPAIVCAILIALDCSGSLTSFHPLSKLVILVNAAVPGALIVVVLLKAQGLSESASIVSRIYLPSYLISILTIAGWTSIGLIISIPRRDGKSFCGVES